MSTRRTVSVLAALAVASGALGTCSYQQALREASDHLPEPDRIGTMAGELAARAEQATGVLEDTTAAIDSATGALDNLLTPRPAPAPEGEFAQLAAALPIRTADAPASYERELFGQRWADTDRNGCDQRNDTLAAAMDPVTYRPGTRDCVVESGTFHDAYTGQAREFIKTQDGGGVDIDHRVAQAEAWDAGAWAWTTEQREAFANDLDNLTATDAEINRTKSDQDIAAWLPPDPGATCAFTTAVITTYHRYDLSPTPTARERMVQLATECDKENPR